MSDMERREFEDSFKHAFEGAELPPSDNVWVNVELELERKQEGDDFAIAMKSAFDSAAATPSDLVWTNLELELEREASGKMRRRLVFYKMLAAACVGFAMCVAGVSYYSYQRALQQGAMADNRTISKGSDSKSTTPLDAESVESENNQSLKKESDDAVPGTRDNVDTMNAADATHKNGKVQQEHDAKNDQQIDPALQKIAATNDVNNKANEVPSDRNDVSKKNVKGKRADKNDNKKTEDGVHEQYAKRSPRREMNSEIAKVDGNVENDSKSLAANSPARRENDRDDVRSQQNVNAVITVGGDANVISVQRNEQEEQQLSVIKGPLSALYVVPKIKYQDESKDEMDPVEAMMRRLAEEERRIAAQGTDKKDKKNDLRNENLWTALGFSAGQFNSINGSVASPASQTPSMTMNIAGANASNAIKNQESKANGVAYSVGVSVGKRLSKRWVVQGGVNYLNQSSEYTAEGLIRSGDNSFVPATAKGLDAISQNSFSATNAKYVPSAKYDVTNNLAYVSVPVQAGYQVLNKKIGVQINAGVSTDVFLQNTIATTGDVAGKSTQGQGSDSQYRPVNFAGLMGTEFSYKLGQHYRLALNPGIRYPFSSIYKSASAVQATPLTFDVGLKFRYIFR